MMHIFLERTNWPLETRSRTRLVLFKRD